MKFWTRRKNRRLAKRNPWQAVLEQLETRALLAAPVVTPTADQLVLLNAGFIQAVAATDADGDEIYLTAEPARFNGDISMPIWRNWSVIIPVSVKPGETVLTVMPRDASSCARPLVYCSSAPLLPR